MSLLTWMPTSTTAAGACTVPGCRAAVPAFCVARVARVGRRVLEH